MSGGPGSEFDRYAGAYARTIEQALGPAGGDRDAYAVARAGWLRRLEAGAGRQPRMVLDLGCGDGGSAVHLLQAFPSAELVGIDVSAASIDVARSRGLPRSEFLVHDGADLSFAAAAFDLVLLAGVLHHVPADATRVRLLGEAHRVLQHGRRLYVFEQNAAHPGTRWVMGRCPLDDRARPVSARQVHRLLGSAGFAVVGTWYLTFLPRHPALARLQALEPHIARLPLGAQYLCAGLRS